LQDRAEDIDGRSEKRSEPDVGKGKGVMTHSIDTAHAPHRGLGGLSTRQLVEMVIGIAVVVVLGIGAFAFVNSTETPIADTAVDAGTLELITHSALDPFETQFVSPQANTAVDAATLELITHSALDPFETQFVSPQVDTAVGGPSDLNVEGAAYPRPEFL
jgi:hypothetical protein